MTESTYNYEDERQPISWPRIAGTTFAIALHVLVFMLLMAPVTAPHSTVEDEVTPVSFIEPPPPPPPPPPPKEPPKTITHVETVVKTIVPPPPEQPPVVFDTPSPVAVQAPPPAPPAPAQADFAASQDISANAMIKPKYPAEELNSCVGGTVVLLVEVDANGTVLNVSIEKSSRNHNLDRSATDAAKHWKFNAGLHSGQRVGGTVRVPVQFTPPSC